MDVSFHQLFVDEVVERLIFERGHGVYLAVDLIGGVWLEVNSVIPGSRWREALRFFFTKHTGKFLVYFGDSRCFPGSGLGPGEVCCNTSTMTFIFELFQDPLLVPQLECS